MNETLHKSQHIAGPPDGPLEPPVAGLIEAWVSAGGVDTRYWRAGTGPCVLVLLDPVTLVEIVTGQALATLARAHRVLIAETTEAITGATSAGSWLRRADRGPRCRAGGCHRLHDRRGRAAGIPVGPIGGPRVRAVAAVACTGRAPGDDP